MGDYMPSSAVPVSPSGYMPRSAIPAVGSPTPMPRAMDPNLAAFAGGQARTNQQVTQQAGVDFAREAIPNAVAFALPFLVPESAPFRGLIRSGLSALGGGGSNWLTQAATGGNTDPMASVVLGAKMGGLQGLGELSSGLLGGTGNAMQLDAVGAGKKALQSSPALNQAVLQERIPVGANPLSLRRVLGGPSPTLAETEAAARAGQTEVASRSAAAGDVLSSALARNQGSSYSVDDVLRQVDAEISKRASSKLPANQADAQELQQLRDQFAAANPSGRISASDLDEVVRSAQERAAPTYAKDASGNKVVIQNTSADQLFHRLLARPGRADLRAIPVESGDIQAAMPSQQGRLGDISTVGGLKDRLAILQNMQKLYKGAEASVMPKLATGFDPLRAGPTLMRRTFLYPPLESRIGLGLSDPRLLALVRSLPMGAVNYLTMQGKTPPWLMAQQSTAPGDLTTVQP